MSKQLKAKYFFHKTSFKQQQNPNLCKGEWKTRQIPGLYDNGILLRKNEVRESEKSFLCEKEKLSNLSTG